MQPRKSEALATSRVGHAPPNLVTPSEKYFFKFFQISQKTWGTGGKCQGAWQGPATPPEKVLTLNFYLLLSIFAIVHFRHFPRWRPQTGSSFNSVVHWPILKNLIYLECSWPLLCIHLLSTTSSFSIGRQLAIYVFAFLTWLQCWRRVREGYLEAFVSAVKS